MNLEFFRNCADAGLFRKRQPLNFLVLDLPRYFKG